MEREGELVKSDGAAPFSDIGKPLLKGCLTGELYALVQYGRELIYTPDIQKCNQLLRGNVLLGATHATASLGLFEILTKKIRTKINDGEPLSLYQEAVCGLASGAIAALFAKPILTTFSQTSEHGYRNLFSTFSHIVRDKGVLAFWRGEGLFVSSQATAYMGMLTSYDRSQIYFTEFEGLPKWQAQMSASIVSAFCASACTLPCIYVKAIRDTVKRSYDDGEKNAYKNIPHYVSRMLTPYSGFDFYARFLRYFGQTAPFCLVYWYIYEKVRAMELFNDQGNARSPTCGYFGKD